MTLKKEKKNRIFIVTSAIVLGIVLFLLLLLDINNTVNKTLTVYKENQNTLVNVLMKTAVEQAQKDGSDLKNIIISNIEEDFPTSSSLYCILAKNDGIIFLKDENTSSTLMEDKISGFFNSDNISSRDNLKYIISTSETQYNGDNYVLNICTKQNYLVKKIKFDELRIHSLGYFTIYGVILLIIIFFTYYKLRSNEKRIRVLENEVKNNRLIIERLENVKNKNYVNSEADGIYSFYSRSIVDEVIACMSKKERMQCIQIDIIVENLKMEHFVLITAILGRIKEGGSISCYWGNNQFKVLLFHSDRKVAQGFIDLFISKYKSDSEEKVEELKIVTRRLK